MFFSFLLKEHTPLSRTIRFSIIFSLKSYFHEGRVVLVQGQGLQFFSHGSSEKQFVSSSISSLYLHVNTAWKKQLYVNAYRQIFLRTVNDVFFCYMNLKKPNLNRLQQDYFSSEIIDWILWSLIDLLYC